MTANDSKSYLRYLNKLVDGHNSSYHRSIGKKPIEADYSVFTKEIEMNLILYPRSTQDPKSSKNPWRIQSPRRKKDVRKTSNAKMAQDSKRTQDPSWTQDPIKTQDPTMTQTVN